MTVSKYVIKQILKLLNEQRIVVWYDKESLNRAIAYLQNVKTRLGLEETLAKRDIYAEVIDLTGSGVRCDCGMAFYTAVISALQKRRLISGTAILGDLTIQGNIKPVQSLLEPLTIAMENGAVRGLLPISNKSQFTSLPEEVVEKVDLVFMSDPERGVAKALEQ